MNNKRSVFFIACIASALLISCDNGAPASAVKIKTIVLSSKFPEPLQSVFFVDGEIGYVSGNKGGIYKTVDSAKNWTPLSSGVTLPIFGLFL
ncbi:WD40/YVTN/BNR-like repeat-containing protein [Hufsiella ginkgonis]|uniref:Glycosyl hydrolase n=1 Tax=Hufsiella ginkgonis TaxID=2695274 RepID=A0A7K1XYS1_9SPHI|nr:hypothetical protein [Hufsiella ginkgonis]MXV16103.1 hypothetical protein [Hufsiella ginkgonis]